MPALTYFMLFLLMVDKADAQIKDYLTYNKDKAIEYLLKGGRNGLRSHCLDLIPTLPCRCRNRQEEKATGSIGGESFFLWE